VKVINITRYNTEDLQAVVDLFVRYHPKWDYRWNTGDLYRRDVPLTLVFGEGTPKATHIYWRAAEQGVRNYVARTPWKAPHRIRLLPTDLIVGNPVEMLTQQEDNEGHLRAPLEVAEQIYYLLQSRFDHSHHLRGPEIVIQTLENEAKRSGTSFCIRYKLSPKRRPTSESKEYELQYRMRVHLADLRGRSKRAAEALSDVTHNANSLLKLAKGRTDGMPFDLDEMRALLTELETTTLPAVRRYQS
jgi:hypothetical protein